MSDKPLNWSAAAEDLGLYDPPSDDKTHYEALGRFLASFANAEGAVHATARKLSGLGDEKARILFGGMSELRAGRFRIDFALSADSALLIAETKFAIAAERNEIAGRIKQLQPEVSNRQIAMTLAVNHDAELVAARQLFAIE
jgi:hypothetical protein